MLLADANDQLTTANADSEKEKPKIVCLQVIAGTQAMKMAYLTIAFGEKQRTSQIVTKGGPLHAVAEAIKELVPHTAKVRHYSVKALGEGTDAEGETVIMLEIHGEKYRATCRNRDTDLGFARAYLGALNQWRAAHRKVRAR